MEANVKHLRDASRQSQNESCIMRAREQDYHIASRKEPPTVGLEAWLHAIAVSTPR